MRAFDAGACARSEKALAGCFADDSHRRNLFGVSWLRATYSRYIALQIDAIERGVLAKRMER